MCNMHTQSYVECKGVVDQVIYEVDGETYDSFEVTRSRIGEFIAASLKSLTKLDPDALVKQVHAHALTLQ